MRPYHAHAHAKSFAAVLWRRLNIRSRH